MTGYRLTFAQVEFIALGNGALFCPAHKTLILADLHLGKSERMARRGGALLPPFETRDTLLRLRDAIRVSQAKQVFLLGDVFDDDAAKAALSIDDADLWQAMIAAIPCVVLAGNHDPSAQGAADFHGITLRHIAGKGPDISGHYHPKLRLQNTARPAFLIGRDHLILPAFGTFTGGLEANDPLLTSLVGQGLAVMTGPRPVAAPFGRGAQKPVKTRR